MIKLINNRNIRVINRLINNNKLVYYTTKSNELSVSECKRIIGEFNTIGGDLPYLILSGAFNSKNEPKIVGKLTDIYLKEQSSKTKQIEFILRMRETLLRAALVNGFPRALNSFTEIYKVIPTELKNNLPKELIRDISPPIESLNELGRSTFQRIYKKNSDKIITNINNYSPDFLQFVIFNYGHVMGTETYLKLWENELILVGCLFPLNVPAQLKSHLIGSRNVGINQEVIDNVERTLSKLI